MDACSSSLSSTRDKLHLALGVVSVARFVELGSVSGRSEAAPAAALAELPTSPNDDVAGTSICTVPSSTGGARGISSGWNWGGCFSISPVGAVFLFLFNRRNEKRLLCVGAGC